MSETIKRINPRRPFIITPAGLKRITLGEKGEAGAALQTPHAAAHGPTAKPRRLAGEPKTWLLAVAHSERGVLDAHGHQAIAAAALLADRDTGVAVLVLGELNEDLAPVGADLVAAVPACGDGAWLPSLELACLHDLIGCYGPRHILFPDNATGDGELGRRLAADLGAEVAPHVVELKADAVAAYRQGGAQMARRALPRVLLLESDVVDTALPFVGTGKRLDYAPPETPAGPYRDLGLQAIAASELPLEEADFIVSAGNGVGDVPTLEAVARMFGAAVGASRVAVDDGKFPRTKQIGATGKTVQASVYMAVGISGAVQHLQGIKACRHVIAINTDASAPIAKRADLTVVDDAQAVMQALLAESSRRNAPEAEPLREKA